MTQSENPFHDKDNREKMEQAFKIINPNCSTIEMNEFLDMAENENAQFGEDVLQSTLQTIMKKINEFVDFAKFCEQNVIEFEAAVKYKTVWASILNENSDAKKSFETYLQIMTNLQNGIDHLLITLTKKTPEITKLIDEAIKICRHDEIISKNTYDIITKDDKAARNYIEGLKVMLENVTISTLDEARQDAFKYYADKKNNRLMFENLKSNLPKTGKLRSRFNAAIAEHKNFIRHYNTLEK